MQSANHAGHWGYTDVLVLISKVELQISTPIENTFRLWLFPVVFSKKVSLSILFPDIWEPLWFINISYQERISDSFWSHSSPPPHTLFVRHSFASNLAHCLLVFFHHVFALLCLVSLSLKHRWQSSRKRCHREKRSLTVVLLKSHTASTTRALLWSWRRMELWARGGQNLKETRKRSWYGEVGGWGRNNFCSLETWKQKTMWQFMPYLFFLLF